MRSLFFNDVFMDVAVVGSEGPSHRSVVRPYYTHVVYRLQHGFYLSDSSFCLLVLQEGSCIISGLSYNGRTEDGKVMWDGLRNIKVSVYETMYTFQVSRGTFIGSFGAWASFLILW